MKIIRKNPNASGAYGQIQTGTFSKVPNGCALWPDSLETETFYTYKGFVVLNIEDDTVVGYEPNEGLYVQWQEAHPEVTAEEVVTEPSQLDRIEAQVAYTAMMTDTLLEE